MVQSSNPGPWPGGSFAVAGMDSARRGFFLVLGLVMVGLGIVGAFLPVMPTTIFLILAAACFARSSPRLEAWLMDHPRFGPTLRDWRRHGAISRRGKAFALSGMTLGYGLFFFGSRPGAWLAAGVAVLMLACALYVASRPAPPTL
ncbi:YbaN family protein [Zavarzinia sp.]|uniref:YbaN family protein n=1 Tax=Zavarzinia sp. TaxID=2027920 RepID=UPI003BB56BD5|nr:YbaN family protein [Zavarzinia sp.]